MYIRLEKIAIFACNSNNKKADCTLENRARADHSSHRSMASLRDFEISTTVIPYHLLPLGHPRGNYRIIHESSINSFVTLSDKYRLPRSSPSSPAPSKKGKRPASASPIRRRLLSSPLLSRRMRKSRGESSDEEGLLQDDSSSTTSYRDLETFQKAQLRQKVCILQIFSLSEEEYVSMDIVY